MIGLHFTHQLAVLRQNVKWPNLVVDNFYYFMFRVSVSMTCFTVACIQFYLVSSSTATPPGVFCVFDMRDSIFDSDHAAFSERCVYQGITYYLPYSTTGGKGYCDKGSIGYRDYIAEQEGNHDATHSSPVHYYPFVVLYSLLVWMCVYLPFGFYYGIIKSKMAEFPQPLCYAPPTEVSLDDNGYLEAALHMKKSARGVAASFWRIRGRNDAFKVYFCLYCIGHGLYLLFVVIASEWYMGNRFLSYGYVTMVNMMSGNKLDLCDPFPLTMGCQILTSGPSGTLQKYNGICEFPHNVMHRRVFLGYFFLYHILIIGYLVNFVYIVMVLVSPKCRWIVLSTKGNIDRATRRGIRIGNILKDLHFGDWLILSLYGSNVQSSYFEHILLAISEKIHIEVKKQTPMGNHIPAGKGIFVNDKMSHILNPSLDETEVFIVHHQNPDNESNMAQIDLNERRRRRTEEDDYFSTESVDSRKENR